jgi:integral membrane protein (TIGR01906 family)
MEKSRKKNRRDTVLSLVFAVALFCFILTFSIGLPIYCRPFYYAQIRPLQLEQYSGFTEAEIKEAYDQVLDYLTLPGKSFGTGVMAHSAEGAAHFADCKVLFDLNASVLLGSALCLLVLLVLRRMGKTEAYRLGRRSAAFYAGLAAVVLPLVIGGLAALNFNRAFVVFHSIFFPGKDNWIFDWRTDEIILVLPQAFFMYCAMLIGASVLVFAGILLLREYRQAKKQK